MTSRFRYSLRGARFTRSCDVIDCVTNRFAIGQFLLEVQWNRSYISCRFKIFAYKYIWLTILTFWGHPMLSVMWDNGPQTFWGHDPDLSRSRDVIGHGTSSVTWPLDSPYPISHSWFIVTKLLSPALFEILGPKDNWVTTLTFLGHVTSSVTWSLDSTYPISYSCPIVTKPLSPALFEILGPKYNWVTTLTFLGHVTSSVTWPLDSHTPFPIRAQLSPSHYLQPFSRYWALNIIGSRPWPF